MNSSFWAGFQKKAAEENPLAVWMQESEDEQKAVDEAKDKPTRTDPRTLSEGFLPDLSQRNFL